MNSRAVSLPIRAALAFVALAALARPAFAQGTSAPPDYAATGAPPADLKAVVAAPTDPAAKPPKIERPLDGASATVSAGGVQTSGNSRLLAMTVNGAMDVRRDDNGYGASLLGNYGQGGPAGQGVTITTENLQGKLRYDRFFSRDFSVFLLGTGRHDRFQGLDFRLNVDPGVKYMLLSAESNALWAELGYDLQYDIRRDEARRVFDSAGAPELDATGRAMLLDKTNLDHSGRLFVGYRRGFNKEVTLSTGVEYLQSFVETTRSRLNFDALFAAKIGGGLAVGVGFSARYDHSALPGKKDLDTSTTVSLIYAFSSAAPPAPPASPSGP